MWASVSRGPQDASGAWSKRSARGHGPPRSRTFSRSVRRSAAAASRASKLVVAHGRQCGTPGVAWTARSIGRPWPAPRPAAPPAARENRDDGDDLARRRQPGGRPDRRGRVREGRRFPAPQGHRPRRVLGRQRPPGVGLLPRPVGLHAGGVQRARDKGSRPRQLRHGPERHPVRVHGAAHARRRDRRARPAPRRRRPRHRVRGRRRRVGMARDDLARRRVRARANRARRGRGRRASSLGDPHLRRGAPLVRRSVGLRAARSRRATGRSRRRRAPPAGCRSSRSTIASATSSSARWTGSSTSTATSSGSPS